MIEIDCSHGEGGGQAVRTALALSLVTGQAAHLFRIRAGRHHPGLKAQLLHLVEVIRAIADAQIHGDEKGSSDLTILPGKIRGGTICVGGPVPISIPLVLNGILPICTFAHGPSDVLVHGATDIVAAMTFDYFRSVLVPFSPNARVDLLRRGYFPDGGGAARLVVEPTTPRPIVARSGVVERIDIYASASEQYRMHGTCESAVAVASTVLTENGLKCTNTVDYAATASLGGTVAATATLHSGARTGADQLLPEPTSGSAVGALVASRLLGKLADGGIDPHACDSLLLWLALVGGVVDVADFTPHIRTTIAICERFVGDRFAIVGKTVEVDRAWIM